jgi:pimeloyl-ACP methyl ester carboxylesterase
LVAKRDTTSFSQDDTSLMRDVGHIRTPEDFLVKLHDGRRMNVRRWPGKGVPLVLLHGLLDSSMGWDTFARTSPNPCIAIDLSGFGNSDCPTRPRFSAYADDIIETLDLIEQKTFVLVGHSLGGAVASVIADRIPRRVKSLVLLAPAGFARHPIADILHIPGTTSIMQAGLPFALVTPLSAGVVYMAMVTNGQRPDAGLLSRLRKQAFKVAPGATAGAKAIAVAGHSKNPLFKRQSKYRGKVFVLWGKEDRLVSPSNAQGLQTFFPQAKITLWGGMGHHPQYERPSQLSCFIADACAIRTRKRKDEFTEDHKLPKASGRVRQAS